MAREPIIAHDKVCAKQLCDRKSRSSKETSAEASAISGKRMPPYICALEAAGWKIRTVSSFEASAARIGLHSFLIRTSIRPKLWAKS